MKSWIIAQSACGLVEIAPSAFISLCVPGGSPAGVRDSEPEPGSFFTVGVDTDRRRLPLGLAFDSRTHSFRWTGSGGPEFLEDLQYILSASQCPMRALNGHVVGLNLYGSASQLHADQPSGVWKRPC